MCSQWLQSCLFATPKDYSPPGSSVHGILQTILEWITMPSSRGSSWPRQDQTHISCTKVDSLPLYHWGRVVARSVQQISLSSWCWPKIHSGFSVPGSELVISEAACNLHGRSLHLFPLLLYVHEIFHNKIFQKKKKKRLDLSEGETSVVKKISLRSSYRSKRFFSPKKTQRCSELCDNGRTFYAGQVIRNEPLNMAKPELSIQHLRYFHRYTFIWI